MHFIKNKLSLIIITIASVVAITIGISFAYFMVVAGAKNEENMLAVTEIIDTDVAIIKSCDLEMNITYDDMKRNEASDTGAPITGKTCNLTAVASTSQTVTCKFKTTYTRTSEDSVVYSHDNIDKKPEYVLNVERNIENGAMVSSNAPIIQIDLTEKNELLIDSGYISWTANSSKVSVSYNLQQMFKNYNFVQNDNSDKVVSGKVEMEIYDCEFISGQLYCDPGNYLKISQCETCPANSYCQGGVMTYNGGNVGLSSCSSVGNGLYTLSNSGSVDQNDCYLLTTEGDYVEEPTGGLTNCQAGNYCPGSIQVNYGAKGGTNTCSNGFYSDDNSASCTPCPGIYNDSDEGRDSINKCYTNTSDGKYIKNANDLTETNCEPGEKCTSTKVYYGGTGGNSACPSGFYSSVDGKSCNKCPSIYTNSDGARDNITSCYATTTAGSYIASANDSTQTNCPAGSACAGGVKIYYGNAGGSSLCTDGKFSTGSATTCTACPGIYTKSDNGRDAQSDCYVTTTAKKYIATAKATAESNCPAGSACAGGTKVYYGSTGGATGCNSGYYSTGSAAACATCPAPYNSSDSGRDAQSDCYITTTAGKYIANAKDTTQTGCPGGYACPSTKVYYGNTGKADACGNGYYATGAAASCSQCPSPYTNSVSPRNSQGSCTITTTGGYYIKTAKDTTQTKCPANYACPSATVHYGSTGSITACAANYSSPEGSTSCTIDTYSIAYNYNSGTKGSSNPASGNMGAVVTISNPTRSSYTFYGWQADSNLATSTAKYGTSSSAVTTAWNSTSTYVTAQYFQNLAAKGKTVTLKAIWCKWESSSSSGTSCSKQSAPSSPKKGDTYTTCTVNSYVWSCRCGNGSSAGTVTSANQSSAQSMCVSKCANATGSTGGGATASSTGTTNYGITTYTYKCA